jgi:large subunit ribosomal protein L19e
MIGKKRLAAELLKVSPKKVKFAADALDEIKKAITRSDMRGLIAIGKIIKKRTNHQSKVRARKIATQKRKGRQKGRGSKRGSKHSVVNKKEIWMAKVRVQRKFIKELRDKSLITPHDYQIIYRKSKGGFFRNKRHIKLFLNENKMFQEIKKK